MCMRVQEGGSAQARTALVISKVLSPFFIEMKVSSWPENPAICSPKDPPPDTSGEKGSRMLSCL